MQVYLSALGWVNEAPEGNRLRWAFDPEYLYEGKFIGLPREVIVERARLRGPSTQTDTQFHDHPSWPVPLEWWEPLPDVNTAGESPSYYHLPKPVQAVQFQYHGPQNLLQVYTPNGELLQEREVFDGQLLRIEDHRLRNLVFLGGPATLTQLSMLDLFAGQADGFAWSTLARLNPAKTMAHSHAQIYDRYGGVPTLKLAEWEEFRTVVLPEAFDSSPETVALAPDDPSPWWQYQSLTSARWEYALLTANGFLDGPDAGDGTASDQVAKGLLLPAMPLHTMVYRVQLIYSEELSFTSNVVPVLPQLAGPLAAPHQIDYLNPQVRLFGTDDYMMKGALQAAVNTPRIIGVEFEEEIGESPIFNNPVENANFEFKSWRPRDFHGRMTLLRELELPFYDTPLRCRGRSLDGWDRFSVWSDWTDPVVPEFLHAPTPPPLLGGAHIDDEAFVFIDHPDQSFASWVPDHAVANTPGSTLQMFRKKGAPASESTNIGMPTLHLKGEHGEPNLYKVHTPGGLLFPWKYVGGHIVAGRMKAEILAHESGQFIFGPVANSEGNTEVFDPGPVLIQQNPKHPSLWQNIGEFPVGSLPQFLKLADALPVPQDTTKAEAYAVRVNMVSLKGPIGNEVSALRHPDPLSVPPPFTVEFAGADFYGRTYVKLTFTNPVGNELYEVSWAQGNLNAADFAEENNLGDYGAQKVAQGAVLFELFSLPITKTTGRFITFGVQQKNAGGFQSDFQVVAVELPVVA